MTDFNAVNVTKIFQTSDSGGVKQDQPAAFNGLLSSQTGQKLHHEVYNFEVAHHHTYIADGIRVHNTSVLDHLSIEELATIVPGSLDDQNGDGSYDYVELDNGARGLDAAGTTVYKQEINASGQTVARAYTTTTDEYGRLVQRQYLKDGEGNTIEGSVQEIVLTGAQFGEAVGKLATPYITAAILGEDASVFDRIVADTIIGTFVQNAFEFVGGSIHDQIVSHGAQNGTLDDIASITFADFGENLAENAFENVSSALTQWVMAEVFESISSETFGGSFANILATQGVNALVDLTLSEIADNILQLDADKIASLGLTPTSLDQLFSGANLSNALFRASIGTILPELESTEAQIGSSLITIGLKSFANIGGLWGSVLGYTGGLILDLIFDEDPLAFADVEYDAFTGNLRIAAVYGDDGGQQTLGRQMANAYLDFVNSLVNDTAQSTSHNLEVISQALTLSFGHFETALRNGDGVDYATAQDAIVARIVDTLEQLQLNDGDVKIATALGFISATSGEEASKVLNDLSMRLQVASDYQTYLENKEFYDELMMSDPESAFAAGWATTFLLAEEYGYTQHYSVVGSAADSVHITSSGEDNIYAGAGDDTVKAMAGDDTVFGEDGNDLINGGSGNDQIDGGSGDDTIIGGPGDDTLNGGAGIDQFFVGHGNTQVDGGSDVDLIDFGGSSTDFTIQDLGSNNLIVTHNGTGAQTNLQNVEFLRFTDTVLTFDPNYDASLVGSEGDDLLEGTDLRDAINGSAGDDLIRGFAGDDFISGDDGDDLIFGGAGDDWLFGVRGSDTIYGGSGNDFVDGGADSDYLFGEAGNDQVLGQNGDDVLSGGVGSDTLEGGSGDDVVDGHDQNDSISGGSGDDAIFGGSGLDTISGGSGDDELSGGKDADSLSGEGGDDIIYGGAGNDEINGGNGDDLINAGSGNDSVFGGFGDDVVYGGDGDDFIFALARANASTPFTFDPNVENSDAAVHYSDWGRDVAYGGAGNDQIALNGMGGIAFGGIGNDTIYGARAQQRIDGGDGYDVVVTQGYNFKDVVWYKSASGEIGAILFDTYAGLSGSGIRQLQPGETDYSLFANVERVVANNGNYLDQGYSYNNGYGNADHYQSNATYSGFVTISDEEFDAMFSAEAFTSGRYVSVDAVYDSDENGTPVPSLGLTNEWNTFGASNDIIDSSQTNGANDPLYTFIGDQRIDAGDGNDSVMGGNGYDELVGGNGADTLSGGAGGDTLSGGEGADSIEGGTGADYLSGGLGSDHIDAGSGDDLVQGGDDSDSIWGGSGDDILNGNDGDDEIHGGSGRDEVYGGTGNDWIDGDDAPDALYGQAGNDTMFGGDGSDQLDGGTGDDSLIGGHGADDLKGGEGADFVSADAGNDFVSGGSGNDTLEGDSGNDVISGDAGNDQIFGGLGNDLISGGGGDDILTGGGGTDGFMFGYGDGTDTIQDFEVGSDLIALRTGNYHLYVFDENGSARIQVGMNSSILLTGVAASQISTSNFSIDANSTLEITHGAVIMGTDLADRNDLRLLGTSGDDLFFDFAGRDEMKGYGGADTFVLSADGDKDEIFDFETGTDKVDISAWGASEFSDLTITQDGNHTKLVFGNEILELKNTIATSYSETDFIITPPEQTGSGGGSTPTIEFNSVDGTSGDDRNALALKGTEGIDVITDGAGRDEMFGYGGADVFVLVSDLTKDEIKDFVIGEDVIDVSAWGATSIGDLSITQDNAHTRVSYNGEILEIRSTIATDLSASDFAFVGDEMFWV